MRQFYWLVSRTGAELSVQVEEAAARTDVQMTGVTARSLSALIDGAFTSSRFSLMCQEQGRTLDSQH